MTIVAASAVRVRVPFRFPFVTAAGRVDHRDAWIIRLRDGEGRGGVGEAGLGPGAHAADLHALGVAVRAAVADPRHPPSGDDPDPIRRAVAAGFAGAIEDHALHGSPAHSGFVPVNATIATQRLDTTLEAVERALDAGFECLKLKVGGEHTTEALVERISLVRALAGGDIELRLDANGAWDAASAPERLAAIGHLDVAYVEQPIAPGDVEALARVRRRSTVPVAADESVGSKADAEALLAAEAADVLVVKPGRLGGPLVARTIARAAAGRGVSTTISTLLDTGVGLTAAIRVAASLPKHQRARAHGLATAGLLEHDLLATPLEVHDGRIAVRTGPLELDEAAVERFAVERAGAA